MSTAALGRVVARQVHLERVLYGAAALGLTIAPNADPTGPVNLTVLGLGGAATALASVRAWRQAGTPDAHLLKTVMRALPAATAVAVDVTAMVTGGWHLDAAASAAWCLSMGWLAPFSRSGRLRHAQETLRQIEAAAPEEAPAPESRESDFERTLHAMWARAEIPGDTRLRRIDRHSPDGIDFSALVKAPDGRAVPRLDEVAVAAAFGVPEGAVTILGTAYGPGWAEIVVTPGAYKQAQNAGPSDESWWAKNIARANKAVPGSVLEYRQRDQARGVTHYVARMEDETEAPRVDIKKFCVAVGVSHEDLRVFGHVDRNRVHVMVCDVPPLAAVNHATRESVTPDERGFWRLGIAYDGSYVRGRVHRPEGIALGLIGGVSGSGKSQLIVLCVAADANAGLASWVATEAPDGKIALLASHVDRHGVGAVYIWRMLLAAVALMDIRGQMVWADGQRRDWSPGAPGCPYTPLTVYVDEFLAACRDEEYGERITALADLLSVKGRKYGIGLKIAGQDIKVDDGMTSTMRNQLKANSRPVILNMGDAAATRRAFDGIVKAEVVPDPLPGEYGGTQLTIEERIAGAESPEDALGVGGVGWIVVQGRPVLMRTLYVDLSGPDARTNLAALCPPATVQALTRHETEALEALDRLGDWYAPDESDDQEEDLDDEGEPRKRRKKKSTGTGTGSGAGSGSGAGGKRSSAPARATPSAKEQVALFLDMLPAATRAQAVDAVAGGDITPEDVLDAYEALTH
ncbi:hypothetical protein OH749_31200 (plasmid) [Streptomyces albidoflavus]|uniref:hypothetical protein n=1 Tax=Streptomyces albidoflavus TaxID=1886 RepID=UPI002F90E97F|nr:hypothetical protein OH749_31200 [Streptomyces albidoflavus]